VSRYVLDNSVAMRWLLVSQKKADQAYAEKVLQSLAETEAVVPHLWHLEAANVLLGAEKRGELETGEVERFLAQLESLPIQVDPLTAHQAFSRTLGLSRAYKLSSYDAAYLELSIREGLPLATLDKDLRKAAKKADVDLYLI
jgi:predicted nucleic acid-binding protein